jgi:hypothetical protein
LLPCDLDFKVLDKVTDRMQAQGNIATGVQFELHEVEFNVGCLALLKICIAGYDWSNTVLIEPSSESQQLQLLDEKKRPLNINVAIRYFLLIHTLTELVHPNKASSLHQFTVDIG